MPSVYSSSWVARRRPNAFYENKDFIKGSAVYVEGGLYNVRGGESNKPYFRCVFYGGNSGIMYVCKAYVDSRYSPSSGRNNGKTCIPCTVKAYRQGARISPGNTGKIGAKSGSGVYVPSGSYNTRQGENKAYYRFSFVGMNGKIYKVKIYSDSVYQPGRGKHAQKDCCPFIVQVKSNVSNVRGNSWGAR